MLNFSDIEFNKGWTRLHIEASGDCRKTVWQNVYGGELGFAIRDAAESAIKENPKIKMSAQWPTVPECFDVFMKLLQPPEARK